MTRNCFLKICDIINIQSKKDAVIQTTCQHQTYIMADCWHWIYIIYITAILSIWVLRFKPVCQKFDHVPLFQPFLPFTAFQAVTSSPAVSRPLRDPPNATSNVMVARLCLHCQ
jgi:hypothetical protein